MQEEMLSSGMSIIRLIIWKEKTEKVRCGANDRLNLGEDTNSCSSCVSLQRPSPLSVSLAFNRKIERDINILKLETTSNMLSMYKLFLKSRFL